ncbi:MAG: hypothetical protein GYB32_01225 [Algicola sp.]|nr:hypothetical protein [Algicola sp.]
MRTHLVILLYCLLTLSCNSDDDAAVVIEPTLDGQWSLTNISGGLVGLDQDFEEGTIVWDFDTENEQVMITNNSDSEMVYSGLNSGTYDYSVSSTETSTVISVDFLNLEIMTLTANQLVLDDGIAFDGFLLTFMR